MSKKLYKYPPIEIWDMSYYPQDGSVHHYTRA